MTAAERAALDRAMRDSPVDLGGDLARERPKLLEMLGAAPLLDDVTTTRSTSGGVDTVEVSVDGVEGVGLGRRIVYVHGGAYALGDAATAAGLASELARRVGATAVSVDYRLAPEHPAPAAVEDVVRAYRGLLDAGHRPDDVVFAGESAGGGLVVGALTALRRHDLPRPAAATVFSPWVDLTLSGASLGTKADADPFLTGRGLTRRAADYAGSHELDSPDVSALYGDLTGLPPLLIQVGSHEILLDDSVRLAGRVAAADVEVTLEVTAGVPHVFQGFSSMLGEAREALDSAGAFLRTHLAGGSDPVTGRGR